MYITSFSFTLAVRKGFVEFESQAGLWLVYLCFSALLGLDFLKYLLMLVYVLLIVRCLKAGVDGREELQN